MHVTHVVAHPPFREGTGTVCYHNAHILRDLGCSVVVYATRRRLRESDKQLDFYHFMPCWFAVGNAFLTPRILSIGQTDILHLHLPFVFGAELTLMRAISKGTPLVVTYHNDLISTSVGRRIVFFIWNRLQVPLILRKARKIIVTSLDYARSSIYGDTIFHERKTDLVEIPNGVKVDVFRPDVEANFVRPRYRLNCDETVLLFVSSLDRSHIRKGLSLLLETLACISVPSVKLLVVGDGDMRSHYEQRAVTLGIGNLVTFAGHVPQAELPAYYAACDVVVIPSLPPEAFGVALAEGMAAGKPTISSNIPGVRTLVEDGRTGFLIEPRDKGALADRIARLALDTELRKGMGYRGRQRIVDYYTWQRAGERLLAMYHEVLGGR